MEKRKKIKAKSKKLATESVAKKSKEIKVKLSIIADLIGGSLIGENLVVKGLSSIDAQVEDTLSILSDKKHIGLAEGLATAYLVNTDLGVGKPQILVKDVRASIVKLVNIFYPSKPMKNFISQTAMVAETARVSLPVNIGHYVILGEYVKVGVNTSIMGHTTIGDDVEIGSNCIIYPNVTIYSNCKIGDNVIIHAGAVIGADGFGFIPGELPTKIPHKGVVVIEDNVEIGANTCIDRAMLGETVIGSGTKLDNLVMVGHNCKIGKSCLIASQTGFAGSITTGDNVIAGGQVGIADHVNIVSGAMFGGQAGIANDIKEKGAYLGSPCMPILPYAKSFAIFKELPELKRRITNLENKDN